MRDGSRVSCAWGLLGDDLGDPVTKLGELTKHTAAAQQKAGVDRSGDGRGVVDDGDDGPAGDVLDVSGIEHVTGQPRPRR